MFIIIQVNKVKFVWIVLSIGPESFLEANPNASNFELKSPTNMTLSEMSEMVWKSEKFGVPFGSKW